MEAIMTILMYAVICLFVGLVLYYVIKKARLYSLQPQKMLLLGRKQA